MKSTIPALLFAIACMVSVGCSNATNKEILGRWYVVQGDFDFFEFFSDGAFLAKNDTVQHSGKWSAINDNRIKAEVTVLGTTTILLFEDIKITGDRMALILNGNPCELSRNKPTSDSKQAVADVRQDVAAIENAVNSGQLTAEQAMQRLQAAIQKLPPEKRRLIEEKARLSTARRNAQNVAAVASAASAAGYPSGSWKSVKDVVDKLRSGLMVGNNGPFRIDGLSDGEAEAAMTFLSLKGDGSIRYIGPQTQNE